MLAVHRHFHPLPPLLVTTVACRPLHAVDTVPHCSSPLLIAATACYSLSSQVLAIMVRPSYPRTASRVVAATTSIPLVVVVVIVIVTTTAFKPLIIALLVIPCVAGNHPFLVFIVITTDRVERAHILQGCLE